MSSVPRRKPHAEVKEAIANFRAVGDFTLVPPESSETSLIHDWGVRVKHRDGRLAWVCLASESCRSSLESVFLLSSERTSKAVAHLRNVHQVRSDKTQSELLNKRKREEYISDLENSDLITSDPQRFARLIETRKNINLNQAFTSGEADDSKAVNKLTKKNEMNATVNARHARRSMIELYASTKKEVIDVIKNARLERFGSLAMMCDFWSCPVAHTKSVGLRVFFVDKHFELKTLLLGVREFNPTYGDRHYYQDCFRAWMQSILDDFELTFDDFYGASSDGGSDCHLMLQTSLKYQWEWCIAHMCHAATKAACGMAGGPTISLNPGMSALLYRVNKTIDILKRVECKGDLFKTLCQMKTSGKSTRLADYTPARFLSISTALQRILEKWDALVQWFDAEATASGRKRKTSFPLKNDKDDLIQIVSLLEPIRQVKTMCQATEDNQVSVLLGLYFARMNTLRDDTDLEHYLSTDLSPLYIPSSDLTPLALMTRKLLQQAFDDRFFSRYTSNTATEACSFVFEMQQKLHPTFKSSERSLIPVVRICCRQKGQDLRTAHARAKYIDGIVSAKLRALMVANATESVPASAPTTAEVSMPLDRLTSLFGPRTPAVVSPEQTVSTRDARVDEELRRWENEDEKPVVITNADGSTRAEGVLSYWQRLSTDETKNYKILPKVVRVLYAIPTSSCHIERDFSVCGAIRTPQRPSITPSTMDMASFLNRNREYVNVSQCPAIPEDQLDDHKPPSAVYPLLTHPADFFDETELVEHLAGVFSGTAYYEDGE